VLPKFEVTVKAQENAEIKEGKVVATISAKYTYGKSIKGSAKILVYSLSYLGAPKPDDPNLAVVEKTVPIDGRQVVEFDMKNDLKIVNNLCVTYLLIDVSVKEELTGRVNLASTTVTVREKSYNIEFIKPDKFKPGLPYTIMIKVTSQNDGLVESTTEPLKVEYLFDDAEAAVPVAYQIGKTGAVTVTTNVPKAVKKFAIKVRCRKKEDL
jgi:CD109 antigen